MFSDIVYSHWIIVIQWSRCKCMIYTENVTISNQTDSSNFLRIRLSSDIIRIVKSFIIFQSCFSVLTGEWFWSWSLHDWLSKYQETWSNNLSWASHHQLVNTDPCSTLPATVHSVLIFRLDILCLQQTVEIPGYNIHTTVIQYNNSDDILKDTIADHGKLPFPLSFCNLMCWGGRCVC